MGAIELGREGDGHGQEDHIKQLLMPAREFALSQVPEVPLIVPAASDFRARTGSRARVELQPTIEATGLDDAFRSLDSLLNPIHDIAVAAFQRMVDQVAGFACPARGQNQALAEAITSRCEQYGFGTYFQWKGQLLRVAIEVKELSPSARRSRGEAAASRGLIRIRVVADPTRSVDDDDFRPGTVLTGLSHFPQLIVARSHSGASRILLERGEAYQGESDRVHPEPRGGSDERPHPESGTS